MALTTDPNDPRLGHGTDREPGPQNEVYLVLSEEERAKGFVRPYRDSYKHVGLTSKYPLRDLTTIELEKYSKYGYLKYEEYPPDPETAVTGRYWTQQMLDSKGCGTVTTMGRALSETYARNPSFYGATYCCGCQKHLGVEEFIWTLDGKTVGS